MPKLPDINQKESSSSFGSSKKEPRTRRQPILFSNPEKQKVYSLCNKALFDQILLRYYTFDLTIITVITIIFSYLNFNGKFCIYWTQKRQNAKKNNREDFVKMEVFKNHIKMAKCAIFVYSYNKIYIFVKFWYFAKVKAGQMSARLYRRRRRSVSDLGNIDLLLFILRRIGLAECNCRMNLFKGRLRI